MARQGLAVLRRPVPALGAIFFQCIGWLMQLLAVWAVMEAFNLDLPLPAAGLVLVLMNVAIIFPLWPGNVGLLQAAVALPLVQYGVPYATGFAYALVLQAVEMSVGVGVGLVFLAREGLSLASLKTMEEEQESEENALARRGGRGATPVERRGHESHVAGRRSRGASAMTLLGGRLRRARAPSPPRRRRRVRARPATTSVTAVTVAVRGTSRRSAISPNDSPGPSVRPSDLDLAPLDHVEAVAGVAVAEDRRPGRRGHDRRRRWRGTRACSGSDARAVGHRAGALRAPVRARHGRSTARRRVARSVAAGSSSAVRR